MADQGRSLGEFNVSFVGFDLLATIRKVIKTAKPIEHTTELNTHQEAYIVRVMPYFMADGGVDGASVTIVDITGEVKLRHQLTRDAAFLDLAMQSSQMGYAELEVEKGVATLDKVAAAQFGLKEPGPYIMADMLRNCHPDDVEQAEALRTKAIGAGRNYTADYRVMRKDRCTRWYKVHAAKLDWPDGPQKYAMITVDTTEDRQLRENLSIESERLKLVIKAGRMGFAEIDVVENEVTVDTQLAEQFGLPKAGTITLDALRDRIIPDDLAVLDDSLGRALNNDEEYEFDFRVKGPKAQDKWMRTRGMPYRAADGTKRVIGPTLDITAEKLAIRHQETLVRELSHRIKNLFTVISALVQNAPKANIEVEDFAEQLISRIVAIGRANDLARSDKLSGTGLRDMLETVVAPHATDQPIRMEGPFVAVAERNVSVFSLVLHELATNATKHGALQHPDGQIDVIWEDKGDDILQMKWTETVPDFQPDGAEIGFGTRLVDIGVKQLKGTVDRQFGPSGLQITMTLQLGSVQSK